MAYDQAARCRELESARHAVASATAGYAKGGGPDALNRANARLADATYEMANPCSPVETGRKK